MNWSSENWNSENWTSENWNSENWYGKVKNNVIKAIHESIEREINCAIVQSMCSPKEGEYITYRDINTGKIYLIYNDQGKIISTLMDPDEWTDDWFFSSNPYDPSSYDDEEEEYIPSTLPSPTTSPVEPKGKIKDGMLCKKCKNYIPYAEPNQPDGSLICYPCRH